LAVKQRTESLRQVLESDQKNQQEAQWAQLTMP
jgi:hypothetical protein